MEYNKVQFFFSFFVGLILKDARYSRYSINVQIEGLSD